MNAFKLSGLCTNDFCCVFRYYYDVNANTVSFNLVSLYLSYSGLGEAQDINMYLKPLRHHFEDFEQAEFDESKKLLAPMMNCLCLVWAHSEYYNTPARIIVLLQEICNMIINMVS